ncbi:MAG: carbamoyl phosphate synthase large subunit, partial [Gammaproteobacteria bacterium]|nr:carbamoyl phosphate synthase large subunit [Gammaproteobacteria bacterium]
VMGVGRTFGEAFAKSMEGGSVRLPRGGRVLLSVREADRPRAVSVARQLAELGFEISATRGTCRSITEAGIGCSVVNKVKEGRPHIVDMIKNNEFVLIINTTEGKQAIIDSASIRRAALQRKVSYSTTISGAEAAVLALQQPDELTVNSLRELHGA